MSLRGCGAYVGIAAKKARWLRWDDVSSGDSRMEQTVHAGFAKAQETKVEIVRISHAPKPSEATRGVGVLSPEDQYQMCALKARLADIKFYNFIIL